MPRHPARNPNGRDGPFQAGCAGSDDAEDPPDAWASRSDRDSRVSPLRPSEYRRETLGYHVFWHRSTEADAGIKAALDHVDQAIADRDFEFDVRVAFDKARQDWREKIGRGILRHVQPDAPRWPFAEAVQVVDRLPDCCHWLCKRAVELLARGRQRYAARCSVDKANPEPSFETLQCVA